MDRNWVTPMLIKLDIDLLLDALSDGRMAAHLAISERCVNTMTHLWKILYKAPTAGYLLYKTPTAGYLLSKAAHSARLNDPLSPRFARPAQFDCSSASSGLNGSQLRRLDGHPRFVLRA